MAKQRKLKRVPSSRSQPEFVPPDFGGMRRLVASKEAVELANNAYQALKGQFPCVFDATGESSIRISEVCETNENIDDHRVSDLIRIADNYFEDRRNYSRVPNAVFNAELAKVQASIGTMHEVLSSLNPVVKGLISKRLGLYNRNRELAKKPASQSTLQIIESNLLMLSKASQKIEQKRGARPKNHVANLVKSLVSMWRDSGQQFDRRFDSGEGAGSRPEFIGNCAKFVFAVATAIDPDINKGEVENALKGFSNTREKSKRTARGVRRA